MVHGDKAVCYCPPEFTGPKCQVSQVSNNRVYPTEAIRVKKDLHLRTSLHSASMFMVT